MKYEVSCSNFKLFFCLVSPVEKFCVFVGEELREKLKLCVNYAVLCVVLWRVEMAKETEQYTGQHSTEVRMDTVTL